MSEKDVSKQEPWGGYRKEGEGVVADEGSGGEESEEEQRKGERKTTERAEKTDQCLLSQCVNK